MWFLCCPQRTLVVLRRSIKQKRREMTTLTKNITDGRMYQQNLIKNASKKTLEILEDMHPGETMDFEEIAEKVSPNWRIAIKAFDNLANLGYLEISDGGKESFGIIKKIS
jgi:hypothetical protein